MLGGELAVLQAPMFDGLSFDLGALCEDGGTADEVDVGGGPRAQELLADKGYDSAWFGAALIAQGIAPCIPPRKNRKVQYHYEKDLYRQRHKIENVFGRIKDWRLSGVSTNETD